MHLNQEKDGSTDLFNFLWKNVYKLDLDGTVSVLFNHYVDLSERKNHTVSFSARSTKIATIII